MISVLYSTRVMIFYVSHDVLDGVKIYENKMPVPVICIGMTLVLVKNLSNVRQQFAQQLNFQSSPLGRGSEPLQHYRPLLRLTKQ